MILSQGGLIDTYLFGAAHPYGRYSSMEDYAALNIQGVQRFLSAILSEWPLCDFCCRAAACGYSNTDRNPFRKPTA